MNGCAEQRALGVASTSRPAAGFLPCRISYLQGRKGCIRGKPAAVAQLSQVHTEPLLTSRPGHGAMPFSRLSMHAATRRMTDEDSALPLYTCLDGDILTPANKFAYYQALRSGLKALRALGINGISVDVYWGIVEGVRPKEYDWSSYKQLFSLIRDEGFMVQVGLCFHASSAVPLPAWLVEAGRANPDIYYTDRAGVRSIEYVSLGADEVPVLAGRSALECYRDFMVSFRDEMGPLFGTTIADVLVGLGPDGELKFPAHPRDKRWTFPGVGEFQCYDKYMLSMLRACSHQVAQPSWGLRGPHDAGTYCVWPHQTGFFNQRGSFGSAYGKFFLQWYSDMLMQHADAVLGVARGALLEPAGSGGFAGRTGEAWPMGAYDAYGVPPAAPPAIRLHAKLPGIHWWYNTPSHAPELTAGYYNTHQRDGYLPVMTVLAKHGVGARLRGAELRGGEVTPQASCDPEKQIAQQRTVAAALGVPVGLENLTERFDEAALSRLETALFDTSVHQGIELPQVQSLVFNRMCDSMFEPGNWCRFKDFVRRVRNRSDALAAPWHGGMSEHGMMDLSPAGHLLAESGSSAAMRLMQNRSAMQLA